MLYTVRNRATLSKVTRYKHWRMLSYIHTSAVDVYGTRLCVKEMRILLKSRWMERIFGWYSDQRNYRRTEPSVILLKKHAANCSNQVTLQLFES